MIIETVSFSLALSSSTLKLPLNAFAIPVHGDNSILRQAEATKSSSNAEAILAFLIFRLSFGVKRLKAMCHKSITKRAPRVERRRPQTKIRSNLIREVAKTEA